MQHTYPSSEKINRWIQSLKSDDPAIRQEALYHLASSAVHLDEVVPAVAKALDDENLDVCREAGVALFCFGRKAAPVLDSLIVAMRHKDTIVRRTSAATISLIGPEARRALSALHLLENDPDELVRVWVEAALKAVQAPEDEDGSTREVVKTPPISGTFDLSRAANM